MNRREPWGLSREGILLETCTDNVTELLWLNPRPTSQSGRAMYPLRVEILCRFEDLRDTNLGLRTAGDFFQRDSLLAAVSRVDDASRVLLYTATWESIVRERFLALRAVLRPTAIGLRVATDPLWRSFRELTAFAERSASGGAEARPEQPQLAALWSACVA
jgi:hypothetical protein